MKLEKTSNRETETIIHKKLLENCEILKTVFKRNGDLNSKFIISVYTMIDKIKRITGILIQIHESNNGMLDMYNEYLLLSKCSIKIPKEINNDVHTEIAYRASTLCILIYMEYFLSKPIIKNKESVYKLTKESIKSMLAIWGNVKNGNKIGIVNCVKLLREELFTVCWSKNPIFTENQRKLNNLFKLI